VGDQDEAGGRRLRRRQPRTEEDFEQFFDRVWPRARAMAVRMGLSREEAEDVALDALARTYDRWDRVRDLPYREAWALKVTSNLVLRRLRRRSGRVDVSEPLSNRADDRRPGWDDGLAERLVLRQAMDGLPRRQRQVVALRYLADLPEIDVARALGIDVGSVKQHASRGRLAMKNALTLDRRGAPGE
jgi:RNA polymerase sigma factor (sigma-70 family)